jgi:hypothetical protein
MHTIEIERIEQVEMEERQISTSSTSSEFFRAANPGWSGQ